MLTRGDYIRYYWTANAQHQGYVDGDGQRLFFVIGVGSKWVTMLHLSNLCICRVSRSHAMANSYHLAPYYYGKLPKIIRRKLAERNRFGLKVSNVAIRKALAILQGRELHDVT